MRAEETSKDGTANWSSSFGRARTETIVTTMIILAVTHLDMNMSRIPVFGIELSRNAPKATILAFLFIFFFYFIIVFVVKFLAEYKAVQLPIAIIRDLEANLKRHMESLQMLPQPVHSAAIDRHISQLNQSLDAYKEATFTRHDLLRLDLTSRWETLDADVIRVMNLKNAMHAIGVQQDEKTKAQATKTIQYALDEARKLKDIDYEREIVKLDDAANAHLTTVRSVLDSFQISLDQKINKTLEDIAAIGNDVKPILGAIQAEMDEIRKTTRSLAKALTWDKVVFGFWVPLIFALVSVGLSVPQAIADMKPLVPSVVKCLPPLDQQCWYREPPTTLDRVVNFFRQLNGMAR